MALLNRLRKRGGVKRHRNLLPEIRHQAEWRDDTYGRRRECRLRTRGIDICEQICPAKVTGIRLCR